jgi:hypothetical protein
MANTQTTPTAAPGNGPTSIRRPVIAIVICCILAAVLIMTIYVFHAPQVVQATVAAIAAGLGASVLQWAFPGGVTAVAATVAVVGLIWGHPQAVQEPTHTATRTVHVPPAKCPQTLSPMALVQTENPVVNSHPKSTNGLGGAHIDNVIALDGSVNVQKYETVCFTVFKYPAAGRQLWLILRLREPDDNGKFYDLFYVVGGLADPSPGRYSVAVDRSCTSQYKGDRHTLFVMSTPASATGELWANYNARLNSQNTDCNTKYDGQRHSLPNGYYIASEQGDVIQH